MNFKPLGLALKGIFRNGNSRFVFMGKGKKEYQKLNSPIWVAVILTDNQLPFLFSETINTIQKE